MAKLTLAELTELYVVRGVLEAAALVQAVALAGPQDDADAGDALAALDRAISDDDYRAYHRESRRFHFALLAPGRMLRLEHILRSVWNLTEPYQPMSRIDDVDRVRLHAEHRQMLAAFVDRDAGALATLAAGHQHDLEKSIEALAADAELFAAEPREPGIAGSSADLRRPDDLHPVTHRTPPANPR